jgi:hypothetical protein
LAARKNPSRPERTTIEVDPAWLERPEGERSSAPPSGETIEVKPEWLVPSIPPPAKTPARANANKKRPPPLPPGHAARRDSRRPARPSKPPKG